MWELKVFVSDFFLIAFLQISFDSWMCQLEKYFSSILYEGPKPRICRICPRICRGVLLRLLPTTQVLSSCNFLSLGSFSTRNPFLIQFNPSRIAFRGCLPGDEIYGFWWRKENNEIFTFKFTFLMALPLRHLAAESDASSSYLIINSPSSM